MHSGLWAVYEKYGLGPAMSEDQVKDERKRVHNGKGERKHLRVPVSVISTTTPEPVTAVGSKREGESGRDGWRRGKIGDGKLWSKKLASIGHFDQLEALIQLLLIEGNVANSVVKSSHSVRSREEESVLSGVFGKSTSKLWPRLMKDVC